MTRSYVIAIFPERQLDWPFEVISDYGGIIHLRGVADGFAFYDRSKHFEPCGAPPSQQLEFDASAWTGRP